MKTLVITPTYNEAKNIVQLVSASLHLSPDIRVLVVDDASPDGTADLAEALAETYPGRVDVLRRAGKLGLRTAYLDGFRWAFEHTDAEAIVQMDADFSHDPQALPRLIARLTEADLVIGSRYVAGGGVDARWPLWRKALSAFGNAYARTILGFPMRDVTTGYRAWRRTALEALPLERIRANGYVFLVEMAYLAWKMGYRILEEPIYFADRRWGQSKMSLRIQLEAALRVWQVKWQYRDIKPSAPRKV